MHKQRTRVRAAAGRGGMPIPRNTAIDTGLRVFTPETPVEVIYNHFIRKRLAAGDLVEVVEDEEPATDPGGRRPAPLRPIPTPFDEGGE